MNPDLGVQKAIVSGIFLVIIFVGYGVYKLFSLLF